MEQKTFLPASILISAAILAGAWIYTSAPNAARESGADVSASGEHKAAFALEDAVITSDGVALPVRWDDLGLKLASVGAIDAEAFKALYAEREAFTEEYDALLFGADNGSLRLTRENAGFLLNLFWALGLASKNPILESGEMANSAYGGAENFASTAGWTLAVGGPMEHYSRHRFFNLTSEQQALVEKVSKGIYRPCCGNSVHFPDCNHGMAMLGLLELMASQGVGEEEMWKTALAVNAYWFPDTYRTLATYMKNRDVDWKDVNPKEMLGAAYSSASGYARIASLVAAPRAEGGGGGCGVEEGGAAAPSPAPRQQSGCGI